MTKQAPESRPYRLGLDLGTNSIGWWIVELGHEAEPVGSRRGGVRLFPDGRDPQTKATLAADRRLARSMRRRRDRYLRRRAALLKTLTDFGMLPTDQVEAKKLEQLDPYTLRKTALDQRIPLHHLGRAIFHLAQRRGFKSNRKADQDAESGMIETGMQRLAQELERTGSRTVGEYLGKRIEVGESVRARTSGTGRDKGYAFYPDRALVEDEFFKLWQSQQPHHPAELTDQRRDELHRIIFFQRPLKPVEPGLCAFEPNKPRCHWAHPLAQRFRFLQELANLRIEADGISAVPLSIDQRNSVLRAVFADDRGKNAPKDKITFPQLRKLLGVGGGTKFSIQDDRRKDLKGDEVGGRLANAKRLGPLLWASLSDQDRIDLVDQLMTEEDEDTLVASLMQRFGLDEEHARATARTALPDSHCRLSEKALAKIVPIMESRSMQEDGQERPIRYDEACTELGWHHSDRRPGQRLARLPYYGSILPTETVPAPATVEPAAQKDGWIPNPTVHISLNQLRQVVNAVIDQYGPPTQIVVELARELKQSKKQKDEANKRNKANKDRRDRWTKDLHPEGGRIRGRDFDKIRLWEELPAEHRICVLTGEPISIQRLFSDQIEIDHILPFSRCLDDSLGNKMLVTREANREKGNRTPHEAFGHTSRWPDIEARAAILFSKDRGKRRKFDPDLEVKADDFLDRHLNDTRYLSRIARGYLTTITPTPNDVWVVPGRLTAMIRRKWGLNDLLGDHNQKNRDDHRHHALDAFVVAMTGRGTLQRLMRAAGQAEDEGAQRIIDTMPEPWEGWDREHFSRQLRKIIVSYKPDHGWAAQMHNETAYGLASEADKSGKRQVVHRVPIDSLKPNAVLAQADHDDWLRDAVAEAFSRPTDPERKAALLAIRDPAGKPVRHVRIVENMNVIEIKDKTGRPYKGYKGDSNAWFEIVRTDKGKWTGRVVSTFDAYHGIELSSDAVLRLFKSDMIAIQDPAYPGGRRILSVIKFSGNSLVTADHFEGGALKARDADKADPFRYVNKSADWYRQAGIRKVSVGPSGRIRDPGPIEKPSAQD